MMITHFFLNGGVQVSRTISVQVWMTGLDQFKDLLVNTILMLVSGHGYTLIQWKN